MSKTAIVFTCSHADPKVNNNRFSWLGELIFDIKPDYVVDLGDGADMRSLNTYDSRYPEAVAMQSYEQDINYYNDGQERLRWKFRLQKKKRPAWFGFEGNHEYRIKRALHLDPRLEGSNYGISFSHLQTDQWLRNTTSTVTLLLLSTTTITWTTHIIFLQEIQVRLCQEITMPLTY